MNNLVKTTMTAILLFVGTTSAGNAQTFKWSGPTVTFVSRCFSEVCLGDDVAKLSSLRIAWLAEDFKSPNKLDQERYASQQRRKLSPEKLQSINAAFRGLSQIEQEILASAKSRGEAGNDNPSPDYFNYKNLVPFGRFDYVAINTDVLNALKGAAPCVTVPIIGAFKSESGNYTSVMLLPENGKLVVTRIARKWVLDVPRNASSIQQTQIVSQELNQLGTQIGESYVKQWIADDRHLPVSASMAVSDDAVAYFNWDDTTQPTLTFYDRSIAAYQTQNRDYDARFKHAGGETGINWETLFFAINSVLATSPACEIKAVPVKIN